MLDLYTTLVLEVFEKSFLDKEPTRPTRDEIDQVIKWIQEHARNADEKADLRPQGYDYIHDMPLHDFRSRVSQCIPMIKKIREELEAGRAAVEKALGVPFDKVVITLAKNGFVISASELTEVPRIFT